MTKVLLIAALTAIVPLTSAHAGPNACVRTVNSKGVSRSFCVVQSGEVEPETCHVVYVGELRPVPYTQVCVSG